MSLRSTVVIVVISSVLVSTGAWYKQVSGPSYYSVGRASGLLSGIQRSSYMRRAGPDSGDESTANKVISEFSPQHLVLNTVPICIKGITPNLQNCELFQEIKGLFKCKADVFISLDSSDCKED